MTDEMNLWIVLLLVLQLVSLLAMFWLGLRRRAPDPEENALQEKLLSEVERQGDDTARRVAQVESELRRELTDSARTSRQELQQTLMGFQEQVSRQGAESTRTQNAQLDAFSQQLMQLRGTLGDTLTAQLQAISQNMLQQGAETTRTQNAQIDAFAQQLVQLRGTKGDTLTRHLQD